MSSRRQQEWRQGAATRSGTAKSRIHDPRIRQAIEYLEIGDIPSLGSVASKLNLSLSRFRHLFKSEVGVSPQHYVRQLRLVRARTLLETSVLRVKEIAAVIGVNDVSHFVRSYKALHHQTPSETRAHSKYVRRALGLR
jgi:transcriptional regulator GlxA family with amidase domain